LSAGGIASPVAGPAGPASAGKEGGGALPCGWGASGSCCCSAPGAPAIGTAKAARLIQTSANSRLAAAKTGQKDPRRARFWLAGVEARLWLAGVEKRRATPPQVALREVLSRTSCGIERPSFQSAITFPFPVPQSFPALRLGRVPLGLEYSCEALPPSEPQAGPRRARFGRVGVGSWRRRVNSGQLASVYACQDEIR